MPFGVQSAGFNSTTLKKLKAYLKDREIFSAKTLSKTLDIELEAVISHMGYLGYKSSGEKMSKDAHKAFVDDLAITKRSSTADAMEKVLVESENIAKNIQDDNAREAAAKAELAEIELAEKKASSTVKPAGKAANK